MTRTVGPLSRADSSPTAGGRRFVGTRKRFARRRWARAGPVDARVSAARGGGEDAQARAQRDFYQSAVFLQGTDLEKGITSMPELQQPQGPICQSCGMPLERPDQFGTSASGGRVSEYCSFCYRDGHFTQPDMTKSEMIARVAGFLVSRRRMSETVAQSVASGLVPKLKRWTNSSGL